MYTHTRMYSRLKDMKLYFSAILKASTGSQELPSTSLFRYNFFLTFLQYILEFFVPTFYRI